MTEKQHELPKPKKMYSLVAPYDSEFFEDVQELCQYVLEKGICPETQILYNGEPIQETVSDYVVP